MQDSPPLAAGSFIDDHAADPLPFMRRRQFERADHLSKNTSTLQYKSFPLLIMRAEFRADKSDKNVFLYGSHPANHQETLSCQVAYIF